MPTMSRVQPFYFTLSFFLSSVSQRTKSRKDQSNVECIVLVRFGVEQKSAFCVR